MVLKQFKSLFIALAREILQLTSSTVATLSYVIAIYIIFNQGEYKIDLIKVERNCEGER